MPSRSRRSNIRISVLTLWLGEDLEILRDFSVLGDQYEGANLVCDVMEDETEPAKDSRPEEFLNVVENRLLTVRSRDESAAIKRRDP